MSRQLISQYYTRVAKLIQFSGSRNEDTIKSEFAILLNHYAEKKNLVLAREVFVRGTRGKDVRPDGTLKNILRLDYGYWESKDEADVLDDEIDKKIKKGYPLNNILFEDSRNAILFQGGQEVMRVEMREADALDRILTAFISFEKPEIKKFNEALEQFQRDIPTILDTLRKKIDEDGKKNKNFLAVSETFLELCKAEINPEITMADVREMMIQHILTSDIFNKIFDDAEFHRHNNIASELEKLNGTLFNHADRKNLLGSIEHYYDAINAAAAGIVDHHEKQKFLKALYENFYKAYNPKAADRLGVVYTPNEIVDFMIDSTNYLLEKHFKRLLWDKNVEILDPATGTGTFICNMIDKCPPRDLPYKYKNELHANDVAILPYYIANLNIEFTYKQKMKEYVEFKNICFVDTLDNTDALTYGGKQHKIFGLSNENSRRISEQNKRKISVIIGNPPYNANQKNENENNKKRDYPIVDLKIKDTYVKFSTSQKTKVYDMYARFFRWSSDRIIKDGIVAFITNNSFIKARGFDGFRKSIKDEFDFAYIIDLDGDVRSDRKQGKGNVFGIMVGVAITFLIKLNNKKQKNCQIKYFKPDFETAKEKIEFLSNHCNARNLSDIPFNNIIPNEKNDWLNITDNDFETLIPLVHKTSKKKLFESYSNGVSTNRDEWVYDLDKKNLTDKSQFFIDEYNNELERWVKYKKQNKYVDIKAESNPVVDTFLHARNLIKWSKMIKRDKLRKEKNGVFNESDIRSAQYRPFTKRFIYFGYIPIDLKGGFEAVFPKTSKPNLLIAVNHTSSQDFNILASDDIVDLHFNGDSQCLSLYRYTVKGERIENITDWGLEQFRSRYGVIASEAKQSPTTKPKRGIASSKSPRNDGVVGSISKEDIFHYTYAVLHNPAYRKKYELNLKREFPRIPFYDNFFQWAAWGKRLMDLHINYETAKPFPLKQKDFEVKAEAKRQKEIFSKAQEPEPMFGKKAKVKVKLKANKDGGVIDIDELTFLSGVPKEAWEYKLGNRSALEWVLDQYKEKKPSDPTIAEKFNTYRFADYKDKVIDLLRRVCTVSVETMEVVREMEKEKS